MSSSSKPYIRFLLSLKMFIVYSFILSYSEAAKKHGFTVELIHRDSPKSPFYNHSKPLSLYQKVNNAAHRSFQRVNSFPHKYSEPALDDDTIVTDVILTQTEYLIEFSIGTPAEQRYGMVDIGSRLVWLQCLPCEKCFPTQVPVFNPSSSSTFRNTSCDSEECNSVREWYKITCDGSNNNNECLYEKKYLDDSGSKGKIVKDTLTLGRSSGKKVAFRQSVFGCANYVDGKYSPESSGVVGLSKGPLSLISQMGYDYKGKFSYCLVPFTSSSDKIIKLSFGENSFAYDFATVSTPFATGSQYRGHYFVTLEGVSVGETRLEYKAGKEGNIIIDNGVTVTYLQQDLMYKLESGIAGVIHSKFRRIHYPKFDLCFSSSSEEEGFKDFRPPIITLHFKGGADIKLYPSQTFVPVSREILCLNMVSSPFTVNIFGLWTQSNYLDGFDLLSNLVSFKLKDCTL